MDIKRGVDCIGVTVSFLCHDGQGNIVLHKRSKNCRDEHGIWDGGGGALEFGESLEDCLAREVREEYCVDILEAKFVGVVNQLREHEGKPTHWVSIVHAVLVDRPLVKIGEPEKMDDLAWFPMDALPTPAFRTLKQEIQMAKDAGVL